ncbi:lipase member K-like isoform X1 [Rhipicephalus sanguineus]|uniref:lipase member K-like isoform X1 n=1 Tax=Rhipicephalus sanguineus TaxID=34632 RepID=UPI0020C2D8F1|nr:lipase member K-like isoform X1 [Rhipicephalus sanguineus]
MRYFGYNVEVHKVTTADGYILEVDRILPSSDSNATARRTPMLLVHGLLTNAASWTANLPSQSPGFLLADAGFDVWLVNTRGVPQSNRHVNLTTKDKDFWKWSFEQIGTQDLPAVIDYILNKTGFTKVGLLTTSQGTTVSLVLLSMRPEYNTKVNILVSYAPVANVTHFTSPMRHLTSFSRLVKMVNDFFTHGGFLVTSKARQRRLAKFCDFRFFRNFCYKPLAFLYGKNPKQYNSTRVPVYVTNLPVGSSSQNLLHYAQMYKAKNFVRFDYGTEKNKEQYKQERPPPYPLENITAPFAIYQGRGDIFANPQDVHDLAERLRCILVVNETVPDPTFGHLDFIYGYNATDILHRHMINLVTNCTTTGVDCKKFIPSSVQQTCNTIAAC